MEEFLIDLTEQIKALDSKATISDEMLGGLIEMLETWEDKDHSYFKDLSAFVAVFKGDHEESDAKNYPGKNVSRRKDGVPKMKIKKRDCKPGEHRDKSGKLKKTKK